MTPKLIRSVAAACLAAALLPAQEEEEIIVRLSESTAKASSKVLDLSSKKLKAIIEKLSDDEFDKAKHAHDGIMRVYQQKLRGFAAGSKRGLDSFQHLSAIDRPYRREALKSIDGQRIEI